MMATINSNYGANDVGRSLQLERQQQERQRLQSDQTATESARQANVRQNDTVQTTQAVRESEATATVRNGTSNQSTRQLEDSLQAQLLNARNTTQAGTASNAAPSQQSDNKPSAEGSRSSEAQANNRQPPPQPAQQQDTSRAELNAYSQQAAVAQYQSSQSLLQDAGPSSTVRTSA